MEVLTHQGKSIIFTGKTGGWLGEYGMRTVLVIAILLAPVAAWAETIYVDDMLRVNVRKQLSPRSEIVGVVVTGTPLEVLQREGGYLKIRTPEGLNGWVNDKYITPEMPARLRIDKIIATSETMKTRVGTLEKQLKRTQQENSNLQKQISSLHQQVDNIKQSQGAGGSAKSSGGTHAGSLFTGTVLLYLLIGILAAAFLGFIFGMRWQQARVSRKLGGFNI